MSTPTHFRKKPIVIKRKKPIVIEAVHYGGNGNVEPCGGSPDWIWDAFDDGTLHATNGADPLIIETLEGPLTVSPGDWIIQGLMGQLYPCRPEIFEATYEPAEEGDHE